MKIKISHFGFENLIALYLAAFIAFGYIYNMYILSFIALLLVLLSNCAMIRKMRLTPIQLLLLGCGAIWFVSALSSPNMDFAIKFVLYYFTVFFSSIFLSRGLFTKMLNWLLIFCGIHIFFVILQSFANEFVVSICRMILNPVQLSANIRLHTWGGACAGITGQTGTVALYIILFMGVVLCHALKNRVWYYLMAPAIIALALTQKRSFLAISVLLCVLFELKNMKHISMTKKISFIAVISVLTLGVAFMINHYFDISRMISKFLSGSESGRDVLRSQMITLFAQKPLFGWGLYATDTILGTTGHNIYLQLLCENGLLGSFPFYVVLFYSVFIAFKVKSDDEIVVFFKYNVYYVILYGLLGNPIYEFQQLFIYLLSVSFLSVYYSKQKRNAFSAYSSGRIETLELQAEPLT